LAHCQSVVRANRTVVPLGTPISALQELALNIGAGSRTSWNTNPGFFVFVVPLARAVAGGDVERGVAICGSGVGASLAANQIAGVRACLIHETFSAHQGVEDDDLNLICLGGPVVGHALAWELVQTFLAARFSGAERHCRRLAKVAELESKMTSAEESSH
jgi:RpiB/LacA/LacB family sugar-phosphate isomerase